MLGVLLYEQGHYISQVLKAFVTPHVSDVMGVIVLALSVCLCVCLCVSLSRPNGPTYRLEFLHGGQMESYLGQVHRSSSQVKGQGHEVKTAKLYIPLTSENPVTCGPAKEETQVYDRQEDDVGCFQGICNFFLVFDLAIYWYWIFNIGNCIRFWQDNAPCHKSKRTMGRMRELGIECVDPPPSSPDLNAIENVWQVKYNIWKHLHRHYMQHLLNKEVRFWITPKT